MFADGWNLITQDALEVMSVCEELGIAVHLAGIFGGTTVSPIFDPMPEHAEQVAAWQALADRHGVSLAAVALGFAALPKFRSFRTAPLVETGIPQLLIQRGQLRLQLLLPHRLQKK